MTQKIRPGGHGSYHPIGFEGREDTSRTLSFTCSGFAEAINQATEETLRDVMRAIRSTLNKVGRTARQTAMDEIRKEWNVPEAILRERMAYSDARIDNLEVEIVFGGRSISLSHFNARQFRGVNVTTARKGTLKTARSGLRGPRFAGVQLEIKRGKSTYLSKAFMQRMWNGHVGIFVRKGKERYPILHKDAVSIASMMNQERVNEAVIARIEDRMLVIFPHELEHYLGAAR